MTSRSIALIAVLAAFPLGAYAQDKASTEKSRTAGGVSEDLSKEFAALDADKDGFVAKQELSSKPDLVKNFGKADKNGDGKLDPAEYRALKAETLKKGE